MNATDERRQAAIHYIRNLQDQICAELERLDQKSRFREDVWVREEGGGGRSRVLTEGGVFEKAGVNFSDVFGHMSPEFAKQIPGDGADFTACGISLVLHPRNPFIPTVHMNFRFLTKGDKEWFGGGADLTPYYPFWRRCDSLPSDLEAGLRASSWVGRLCEVQAGLRRIFFCRTETRLGASVESSLIIWKVIWRSNFAFVRDAGDSFLATYMPSSNDAATPHADKHRVSRISPWPLRRIQSDLRSRYAVWFEDRWACGIDSDVVAAGSAGNTTTSPTRRLRRSGASAPICSRVTGRMSRCEIGTRPCLRLAARRDRAHEGISLYGGESSRACAASCDLPSDDHFPSVELPFTTSSQLNDYNEYAQEAKIIGIGQMLTSAEPVI